MSGHNIDFSFQFLILGYMYANGASKQQILLSIPHFRILKYGAKKDKVIATFQFLILGYKNEKTRYSTMNSAFQFLILGYSRTLYSISVTMGSFNSSF